MLLVALLNVVRLLRGETVLGETPPRACRTPRPPIEYVEK